ncbi:unnamed protein product [Protopolystoma xenopodis]|uniref:Uncharacterized protein n=1 Tax=Protopolystoma xenopodis TaxID=117903 RepID=A0A448XEN1_9PLAT|nr:unnamed protein product [Protopolystoma xenopodis]
MPTPVPRRLLLARLQTHDSVVLFPTLCLSLWGHVYGLIHNGWCENAPLLFFPSSIASGTLLSSFTSAFPSNPGALRCSCVSRLVCPVVKPVTSRLLFRHRHKKYTQTPTHTHLGSIFGPPILLALSF